MLVSPATRARQTWETSWDAMKEHAPQPQVEIVPELYGADTSELLHTVRVRSSRNRRRRLMIVGHNPGLHEFALALTGSGDAAGRATRAGRQFADQRSG